MHKTKQKYNIVICVIKRK